MNSFLEGLSKNIDKLIHASASKAAPTLPYHTLTPTPWQPQLIQEQPIHPQFLTQTNAQTIAPWQQWQQQPFMAPTQGQQIQPQLQTQTAIYSIPT